MALLLACLNQITHHTLELTLMVLICIEIALLGFFFENTNWATSEELSGRRRDKFSFVLN